MSAWLLGALLVLAQARAAHAPAQDPGATDALARDALAQLERARAALRQGDLAAVEALLDAIPGTAPANARADAALLRGNARFERDDFEGAQRAYEQSWALVSGGRSFPADAAARESLARAGETSVAVENWWLAQARRDRRELLRARARSLRLAVLAVLAVAAAAIGLATRRA